MKTLNENLRLRLLDTNPLEMLPPPGFLPDHMPEHPPGETCVMCESRVARKPAPMSVRVMSIDGVPQPLGTYMLMRPKTLNKIMQAIKGDDEREQ